MALNIELLKRLRMRFLRMRHRKHFDMSSYADRNKCGTSMCIAGHALALQGYKVKFEKYKCSDGKITWLFQFFSPKGRKVRAPVAAKRELGLSDLGASDLFSDFTIKTPKQAATRIQRIIKTGKV